MGVFLPAEGGHFCCFEQLGLDFFGSRSSLLLQCVLLSMLDEIVVNLKTLGLRRANWCAPRPTNMLLSRSLSLLLGSAACRNMLKYVGDATRGFIVTLGRVADGMCKARPLSDSWRRAKFPMSWGKVKVELARWVDEPPKQAVRPTCQRAWGRWQCCWLICSLISVTHFDLLRLNCLV